MQNQLKGRPHEQHHLFPDSEFCSNRSKLPTGMRTLEGSMEAGSRGGRVAEAAPWPPDAAALNLDARQRSCARLLQFLLLLPIPRTLLANFITCCPHARHDEYHEAAA